MNFEIEDKIAFDIPLKNVSNVNVIKNEGILQFSQNQNDDSSISLMEIRFHIPQNDNDVDSAQVKYNMFLHSLKFFLTFTNYYPNLFLHWFEINFSSVSVLYLW